MDNQNPLEDTNFSDNVDSVERALHNSLIFQNLLSFIPKPHWRSVRLVCTTWEKLSRAQWRKNVILQIKGVSQVALDDEQQLDSWNCVTMKQILEQMFQVNTNIPNDPLNLIKHPFRKVRICPNVPIGTNDEIETTFWKLLGPPIKSLYLEHISVSPSGAPQLRRILGELTPNLEYFIYSQHFLTDENYELILGDVVPPWCRPKPVLMTISVEDMNSNKATYRCQLETFSDTISPLGLKYLDNVSISPTPPDCFLFPFNWELFFGTCPNIKTVSGYHFVYEDIEQELFIQQIKQIKAIREKDHSALNIECWNGTLYPGDPMTQFCALGLPLKTFFGTIEDAEEGEGVHEFLTAHQNTLKSFTVQACGSEDAPLWLPEGLTYFGINVGDFGCNLDSLAHTPNLETFVLNISSYNSQAIEPTFAFGQMYISPLKHLTKFTCAFNLDEATFSKCVNLMPNLKKVKIAMDDTKWMIASMGWPSLECCEGVDDMWPRPDEYQLVWNEEAFVKFAAEFKNLKTLVIGKGARFGDMSIHEGFLKMPALENLTVKFLPEVSPAAILLLKKKIPFVNC